ncbi:hypothetical protein K501DRAFT_260062 [Backusella circina FSU 941]|nr:hypothetical protein K501DRAFT_260062 [Backusella circina FSU 941]
MTELSEQEKLEKRRARRQQRILASASSRLNKITGTQSGFRESATPSPSPSPSTSSTLLDAKTTLAEHFPTDTDPRRKKYATQQDIISKHRPIVQKMIREEEERSAQDSLLGGKIPNMIMASMLFSKPTSEPAPSHPSNKYWNLLHFVSMVWLGLCAVYSEWSNVGFIRLANAWQSFEQSEYNNGDPPLPDRHFPVFRYFVTLQIAMHLGRTMYQEEDQRPATESSFSSIVAQLPEYMKEPVCLLQKYGLLVNGVFRDICITMFVIGFSCILAAIFYNDEN